MRNIFDTTGNRRGRNSSMIASDAMTPEEKARRQKKTKSVRNLAQQIHKLRRKVTTDMKSDDEKTRLTALVVAIIDKTAERVGNNGSAKDGHFGVTGFQNGHVTVSGDKVTLKYVGKSGVDQEKSFTDKGIASALKECKGRCKDKNAPVMTTSDGFQIKADKVNRYLKDFDITAKDIRGYGANTLVVEMLNSAKTPSDPEERKKKFREILKSVAEKVGHQQATLKMHYLLPGVEESYIKSGRVKKVKNAAMRVAIAEKIAMDEVVAEYTRRVVPLVKEVCKDVLGYEPEVEPIRVAVSDDVPDGKVGSYLHPSGDRKFGLLRLHPDTVKTEKYKHVVVHELVHALIGPQEDPHGEIFRKVSQKLGMPEEYMD